jgi:tetratricopeptide (TPR) repeat protein
LDNLPEAVAHFSKAVSIDPNAISSFVALSQVLMRQGNLTEGLSAASHAVELTKSQNVDALLNLADIHSRLQKWQPAIEACKAALTLVPPRSSAADTIRGRIAQYQRNFKPGP